MWLPIHTVEWTPTKPRRYKPQEKTAKAMRAKHQANLTETDHCHFDGLPDTSLDHDQPSMNPRGIHITFQYPTTASELASKAKRWLNPKCPNSHSPKHKQSTVSSTIQTSRRKISSSGYGTSFRRTRCRVTDLTT